ncbi:alkene reductase [Gynuella sunshinyii]|uniref:NADH:flavin oxidoreductase, Old Yellow Enzyme family n=1 Tax=Gynuella sunshinyii YC6258 TaxID=1445510 RepID=A0A0C5VR30_9GAMM|nr:alkene reductase [Gynuella sunshinyii]AJQ97092.1 NADH:flavin oxidoreductase, Old Yellow Enzyme family [Gynuella sunshinyii YC6258]
MPMLHDPLQLGDFQLKNRIIMAPLTRSRADNPGRVPNELMVQYYRQRASAGLILSEATSVTPLGVGYADTPGIWSEEQVEGWKKVTNAVHDADGRIFMQLWHVGRISDPLFLFGELPVAPSAIKPAGHVSLVRPIKEYVTPRALATEEVKNLSLIYRKAAENAKAAGFDGVEIHAANGYLIDQFLQDSTNHRSDEYGGSIENRSRLLLEIVDAVIDVWGAGKVGVHLAPQSDSHDMGDSDPEALFSYVARQLNQRSIAFIFAREAQQVEKPISPVIRENFSGVFVANQQLDRESAEQLLKDNKADAVSFGVLFIANPDLVKRLQQDTELNQPQPETFYSAGEKGYIDYPFLSV